MALYILTWLALVIVGVATHSDFILGLSGGIGIAMILNGIAGLPMPKFAHRGIED